MCGIAGIYAYHDEAPPVDRRELRAIRDHMATRGPDGKGEWYSDDGRLGLGHRRLSIIDLSDRASQPMASADGRLVVTFNGEIYNYQALRRALETRGNVFRTRSDTEVLLHLYAEKGEAMVHDLRGMFAFALWDGGKRAMLLARDPFGVKPLYYADDGWTLRLASQVKALLTSPRIYGDPEPAGIVGFYLFGSVPEPYTIYREICSLPAGSSMWVDETGPRAPRIYYSIAEVYHQAERGPLKRDPSEVQAHVREALLDSVRHHLVADVPVGAFLSAGVDSGALIGLMRDAGQADIQSVTLTFQEFRGKHDDEAPLAEQVARQYGTRHTTRMVSEREFKDDLHSILEAMDQPTIDGINTWFVSKAAKEAGLKVAISGLGGDELFGGYPSFRDIPRWVRWLRLPSRIPGLATLWEGIFASFPSLGEHLNPKMRGLLRYGGSYEGAYLLRRGLFLPEDLPQVLDRDLAMKGLEQLDPPAHIRDVLSGSPVPGRTRLHSPHARVSVLESTLYMKNQLLHDTDWASMAHSLEVRVPLVDRWLLERIASCVVNEPASNDKHLLSRSPRRPLAPEIMRRRKSGFSTPIARWQQRQPIVEEGQLYASRLLGREPWARLWSCQVGARFLRRVRGS